MSKKKTLHQTTPKKDRSKLRVEIDPTKSPGKDPFSDSSKHRRNDGPHRDKSKYRRKRKHKNQEPRAAAVALRYLTGKDE